LGGLIVKQILLDLNQQKGRRAEAAVLLECVREVVFLATPHTGSRQASLLDRLRFLAWPSPIARTLVANDPSLRAINVGYRGLAEERGNVLHHLIFYETRGTQAGVIVDEASADPGLPGRPPVPIDADHVSIAKRGPTVRGKSHQRIASLSTIAITASGIRAAKKSTLQLHFLPVTVHASRAGYLPCFSTCLGLPPHLRCCFVLFRQRDASLLGIAPDLFHRLTR
jgi:hypothetical protein